MKRWLFYIMIPVMLLQSNASLFIITSFYYNHNYIQKYLCIQRDIANNSCQGQCYLMQKVQQQQEQEQESLKVNLQEAFMFQNRSFDFKRPTTVTRDLAAYSLYRSKLHPQELNNTNFRPPIV